MEGVESMKKHLLVLLIVSLLFGMISCGKNPTNNSSGYSSAVENSTPTINNSTPLQSNQQVPMNNETISSESTFQSTNSPPLVEDLIDTPIEVIFYKEGMKTISCDAKLNNQILQDVINEFNNEDIISIANLAATTDLIRELRRTEMAIEIQLNQHLEIDNPIVKPTTKTLFITVTGKYDYMIFRNTFASYNDWSGPIDGGKGMEKYFENITFTPLTEEEKRWQSTVETPEINFYEKGNLIGESKIYSGMDLNYKVATHIEKWFYKKDNIQTIPVQFSDTQIPWGNVNYIELLYNHKTTFYGEEIIKEKYYKLIIPLEGEYAYHIFTYDFKEYSNIAYITGGSGLEQYFEEFKNK